MTRIELGGRQLTRRESGIYLIAAGTGLFGVACGFSPTPTSIPPTEAARRIDNPTPATAISAVSRLAGVAGYALEINGTYIEDRGLTNSNHPFLETLRFSFNPDREKGSLVMNPSFKKAAEFRLIGQELDSIEPKNPGFIYCKPSLVDGGPLKDPKFPVVRFNPKEEYTIYLGFKLQGKPCSDSYAEMRAYYITRDSSGQLTGRFDGIATINLDMLTPRDNEASQPDYWQTGCLS